ncbi:MAG: GatB/YqeY domain-containing protein [Solirubrobacterales bacterium]
MSLTDQIQADANAAAKAQDRARLGALRMLLDALGKEAKEQRDQLDEQAEIAVLSRERKRRVEAAEAFSKGGRSDAAAAERAEAEIIDAYLPEQLGDEDLRKLVEQALSETGASSPQEMGKVMSAVMPKVAGRADGKRVNEVVRAKLVD